MSLAGASNQLSIQLYVAAVGGGFGTLVYKIMSVCDLLGYNRYELYLCTAIWTSTTNTDGFQW